MRYNRNSLKIILWHKKYTENRCEENTMLARLEMKLEKADGISYQMSSAFHGALMELFPKEYGEKLHLSKLHPYTQHLEFREGDWYWIVTALNEETADQIIGKVLMPLSEITIKKHHLCLKIQDKMYKELSDRELAFSFYQEQSSPFISIHFITPTTFKQNGKYLNYPDIRCIYTNLMNKYDASNTEESMKDEETLEQLVESTSIFRYDLKSIWFSLESVKIPAFIGKVTFRLRGSQTMINFANLLFRFSTYSGIGIKTALGMGAVRIMEERKKQNG